MAGQLRPGNHVVDVIVLHQEAAAGAEVLRLQQDAAAIGITSLVFVGNIQSPDGPAMGVVEEDRRLILLPAYNLGPRTSAIGRNGHRTLGVARSLGRQAAVELAAPGQIQGISGRKDRLIGLGKGGPGRLGGAAVPAVVTVKGIDIVFSHGSVSLTS